MTPQSKMKKTNLFKIGAVVIILAAIFYGGCQYGINSVLKTVGTVKTVTKDSIVYRDTGRIVPYRIDVPIYIKGKDGKPYPVFDTLWGTQEVIQPADTAAILARYYETAHYQHIVDTGRWKITVDESITQNRIKNWSLKAVSSDTVTVNTVQLKPPKNFVLYFGIDYLGRTKTPFYAIGADLSLKLPNDKLFSAGALIDKDGKLIWQGSYKMPIKFKKRN